ncbi:MAG: polyprenyl synthetase family protein [Labilithrix sp.]|nr:polyprenyl synthetase family protein [Labilithrix sp.]MCW5817351.1 polyprenyl synthetase family protein [Labilithrix sp.]
MAGYALKTPTLVKEVMEEYGSIAQKALMSFLPDREPRRYLYDLIRDYPQRGGRAMRPAICMATARAHGAPLERTLNTATFIELLHNALLVIDDIQDESDERRKKPTLHRLHGVPVALNVGSTMTTLSLVPLLQNVDSCGPFLSLRLFQRAIEVAQQCAEGQSLELGWRLDNLLEVTEADYLNMVLRKTCSYSTVFPIRAGVMIATGAPDGSDAALRYGFLLGAAFQIQDDVLNIAGDHAQYGKEHAGDLLEGKRTLLTCRLMSCATPDEKTFAHRFLGTPRAGKSARDLERMLGLIEKYDCVEYARRYAQGLVGAALHDFDAGFEHLPASRDKEFLRGLSTWIIEQT